MKIIPFLLLIVLMAAGHAFATAPTMPGGEAEGEFVDFKDPFEKPSAYGEFVADPLEPVNRAFFWANDKLYTYLLKPLCESVPDEIRQAVATGIRWVTTPVRVGNVEMRMAFRDGGSELGRFVARGLLSLAGRENPAATTSVAREDFNRAFEEMGMTPGFYLILPVFGPSTLRDGVGRLASVYVDTPLSARAGHEAVPPGDSLSEEMKTYAAIRQTALDPYLFIRDAYSQQQVAARGEEKLSAGLYFRAGGNGSRLALSL